MPALLLPRTSTPRNYSRRNSHRCHTIGQRVDHYGIGTHANVIANFYFSEDFSSSGGIEMIADDRSVSTATELPDHVALHQSAIVPDDSRTNHNSLRMVDNQTFSNGGSS